MAPSSVCQRYVHALIGYDAICAVRWCSGIVLVARRLAALPESHTLYTYCCAAEGTRPRQGTWTPRPNALSRAGAMHLDSAHHQHTSPFQQVIVSVTECINFCSPRPVAGLDTAVPVSDASSRTGGSLGPSNVPSGFACQRKHNRAHTTHGVQWMISLCHSIMGTTPAVIAL
jgi:hypothetical protein